LKKTRKPGLGLVRTQLDALHLKLF
jgi:hypothetical protein